MSQPTVKMADYKRNQNNEKRRKLVSKKGKKNNKTELTRIQKLFSFSITPKDISIMMKQNPDSKDTSTINSWKQLFHLKDDGLHYDRS